MVTYKRLTQLMIFCIFLSSPGMSQENRNKDSKRDKDRQEEVSGGDEVKSQEETEEDTCEVLLPSISETYEGKCKNGLAHGKGKATGKDVYEGNFKKGYPHGQGVFTYETGDVYNGNFRNGRMDGEGSLKTTIDGRDTILDGIWVEGVYAGPKPKHPQVLYKYGVDSYTIKRTDDGDRFLVEILLNGMPNADLEDFTIVATSGTPFRLGPAVGFENVSFPVTCKLRYKTWNKIRTSRHESIFEFKLEEAGEWKIRIVN